MQVYSARDFSSFHTLNAAYLTQYANAPNIEEKREVSISQLDQFAFSGSNFLLKIDTQGAEASVLRGAVRTLEKVNLIILEIPFLQIYTGGCSVGEVFELTRQAGFFPGRLFANSITSWGAWVDADVVFFRRQSDINPRG